MKAFRFCSALVVRHGSDPGRRRAARSGTQAEVKADAKRMPNPTPKPTP